MTDYLLRIPEAAPDTAVSRKELPDLGDFIAAMEFAKTQKKYEHWDRIRRKRIPPGLTHRQCWAAIKLLRSADQRPIPFFDTRGRPFVFGQPDQMAEHLHRVDLSAGGRIGMAEQVTNPDTRDRYYVSSIVQEAITSSQLEGAVTTREVAKEMIRTSRAPRDQSERMILNNYLTMRSLEQLKDQPLTPELICQIHRLMTQGTLTQPKDEGRLRTADRKIDIADNYNQVLHSPPHAEELPDRISALCSFANGQTPDYFIHPVIRSVILHFWLAYDHPFVDGNGRTARALFYWSMLRHGYWLFEFISISQIILEAPRKYYRAFLYTETDENDLTYFILYHLNVNKRAIQKLNEYIATKAQEVQVVDRLIRSTATLNHRQRALLSHALRHPHQRYTTESHRSSQNVTYQTARNDLIDLERRGLLTKAKIGRTDYFRAAENLTEKLKSLE